jgi:cobalt-precorrin 5A hydrolase
MGLDPMTVAVGMGFRAGAAPQALAAALAEAAAALGGAPFVVATAADKAPALAAALGAPVVALDPAALAAADPFCPTRSAASLSARGVGSLAEAAALAAAGPGAVLDGPRRVAAGGEATTAVARRTP